MTYGTRIDATNDYRLPALRHEIESASPHRLIQLMMERVLTKIAIARGHMEREATSEKGRHISDAINIISGLQVSLNYESAPRLASNFDALYEYMSRRLIESNLKNDADGLNEVADLMRELKEAWDVIGDELNSSDRSVPATTD